MKCPYCNHDNPTQRPTCGGCGSDLPQPSCRECGVLVDWDQLLCWRCESLGSDTDQIAMGGGWQIHGIQTGFVGRAKEVHVVNELLRSALESRSPQLCVVVGAAGMGKSRLVAEFHGQLDKHFDVVTVARGECRADGGPPYVLFQRLLRDRFYIGAGETAAGARRKLSDGISSIAERDAERTAHLLGHLVGLQFPDSPHTTHAPQLVEADAYQALARLVEADARRSPLVLVLEDLHDASEESLELITHLCAEVTEAPVLFICTVTPSEDGELPALADESTPLTTIDLQPLSDEECAGLLSDVLRQAGEVPAELVALVCDRALGNPFTLEEIVRLLLESGVIERTPGAWKVHLDRLDVERFPQTQDGVVRARLAALTDHERSVLGKAAVIGEAFWFGALAMLERVDSDYWPEEDRNWYSTRRDDALRRVLRGLRRKDIVRRARSSRFERDTEYRFKHRLEREALYPPPSERTGALHRRVAQWLEGKETTALGHPPIEDIARHYELAGNRTKAAYYRIRAGDAARQRFLNEQAIHHYEQGLKDLSDDDLNARIDTLHDLGGVCDLIGQHDAALCHFQEMLRLAWQLANRAKGGVAFQKIGREYRALGEYAFGMENFERARALFEEVGDVAGLAAALDDMGRIHWLRGDLDTALRLHEEGLELRRELDRPRSVALSLARIGAIHVIRGNFEMALTTLRESLELRRQTGDLRGVAESLNALGVIFHEREEFAQAVELWGEALEAAREVGAREIESKVLNNIGEARIETGDLEDAAERLQGALRITEETRARGIQVDVLRNLGRLAMLQGDIPLAVERVGKALQIADDAGLKLLEGLAWATLGEVHSRTLFDAGRDASEPPGAEADRCFERAAEVLRQVGNEAELGKVLRVHGNVLIERGEVEAGKEKLEIAAEIFRKLDMQQTLQRTEQLIAELAPVRPRDDDRTPAGRPKDGKGRAVLRRWSRL